MSGLPQGCVERCPACAHRLLSRAESEAQKRAWVERWVGRFGPVEPICGVPGECRLQYRDKVTLRAELQGGEWKFGVRRRVGFEWEFVEISDCPVHTARVREILHLFRKLPEDASLVFLSCAGSLATLTFKARALPESVRRAVRELSPEFAGAGVTGLFANLNPSAGNRVFASRGWVELWGEKWARNAGPDAVLGGVVYGPSAFQQPIAGLYSRAIRRASEFLAAENGDSVLDLYSGAGATLRLWSQAGARAIGAELSGEAVALAAMNAPGVKCLRGKVSDRIPQLEAWLRDTSGTVLAFVNPPRAGLEPEVLKWLACVSRPRRLAYLSCNAKTQARDLEVLVAAGYVVKRITPYDFFPQTLHVESLAELDLDSAHTLRGSAPSRLPSRAD